MNTVESLHQRQENAQLKIQLRALQESTDVSELSQYVTQLSQHVTLQLEDISRYYSTTVTRQADEIRQLRSEIQKHYQPLVIDLRNKLLEKEKQNFELTMRIDELQKKLIQSDSRVNGILKIEQKSIRTSKPRSNRGSRQDRQTSNAEEKELSHQNLSVRKSTQTDKQCSSLSQKRSQSNYSSANILPKLPNQPSVFLKTNIDSDSKPFGQEEVSEIPKNSQTFNESRCQQFSQSQLQPVQKLLPSQTARETKKQQVRERKRPMRKVVDRSLFNDE